MTLASCFDKVIGAMPDQKVSIAPLRSFAEWVDRNEAAGGR